MIEMKMETTLKIWVQIVAKIAPATRKKNGLYCDGPSHVCELQHVDIFETAAFS